MELNNKVQNILIKVAKKDDRFLKYYTRVVNHRFRKIDGLLFRNNCIDKVGILVPFDTIVKQMYYVENNGHKIYIWIWIDEQDNIIELELYDIDNNFEYEKFLDIVEQESIKIEDISDR